MTNSHNQIVKCCRCRNRHLHNERVSVPSKKLSQYGVKDLVCPRCSCLSYYEVKQEIKK